MAKVFAGQMEGADYRDLLSLLFLSPRHEVESVIALEKTSSAPATQTNLRTLSQGDEDHFAVDFICDTLRIGCMNPKTRTRSRRHGKQLENTTTRRWRRPARCRPWPTPPALASSRGAGVIKTMGSITERRRAWRDDRRRAWSAPSSACSWPTAWSTVRDPAAGGGGRGAPTTESFQAVLVAHLHGNAAQISVEIGRGQRAFRRAAKLPRTRGSAERYSGRRLDFRLARYAKREK